MRTLFLVVLLALTPLMARADSLGMRVEAGGGAAWVTDRGFDVVSDTDVTGAFTLGFGWAPGWLDERLSLRLAYTGSGAQSDLFGGWKSIFTRAVFDLGGRYDFVGAERFKAFVRAGVYADLATLEVDSGALSISDWTVGGGVLGALGGEVVFTRVTPASVVGFSALLELGWSQRFTKARFDDMSLNLDDDPAPVAMVPVSVGDIDLSGPFLSAALLVRF